MKRTLNSASLLLLAILSTTTLTLIAVSPEKHQWDFRTYYLAGRAFMADRNPYDVSVLSELAGETIKYAFVYPPQTLALFGAISGLDYGTAYVAWLGAKVVCIGLLVTVWHFFLRLNRPDPFFCLFALVGFNAAMIADLDTGNVAVFEQVFLWTAFLAYTRKRWWLFALSVAVSSFFKTAHVLFLGLFLFGTSRERLLALVTGLAAAAAPFAGSFIAGGNLFREFLSSTITLLGPLERGANNPTAFAFLEMARESANSAFGWSVPEGGALILLAVLSVPVILFTARILARLSRSRLADAQEMSVALSCTAFALLLPRFKIYSFVMLIPPAYQLFQRLGTGRFERSLLAFIVIVPAMTTIPRLNILSEYHLFFVALGLFLWTGSDVLESLRREGVPTID